VKQAVASKGSKVPGRRVQLQQRIARLSTLKAPVDLDGQARESLTQVWSRGRAPATISLRRSFIALDSPLPGELSDQQPPSSAQGPPLARLITPRGVGLRTALIALFVAQCSRGTPAHLDGLLVDPEDDRLGWRHLVLAAASHDPRSARAATVKDNQVRQVKAALDKLSSDEPVRLRL
jgi:hypothetical protein